MTTVSLSELLDIRDASIRTDVRKRRRSFRIPKVSLARILPALAVIHSFIHKHMLVLFGCATVVTSAGMVAPALGWLAAGASFFFLEARRR